MSEQRAQSLSRLVWLLAACLLLAFTLRLYHLPVQSLSYDEAVSVYLAKLPLKDMLAWTAGDVQPPLYYLLLKPWIALVGDSEFSLRFLSLLWSVLAVALFYRLGAAMGSRRVGMLAALVAAVHPWYVWHAQDARMYSQLVTLCLLATYTLVRQLQTPGRGEQRGSGILVLAYTAALYTHYLAVILFVYHFLAMAVYSWLHRRPYVLTRYVAAVILPSLLVYLPWLPAVLSTYRRDTSFWEGPLKAAEAASRVFTALFVGGVGETILEQRGLIVAMTMASALLVSYAVAVPRLPGRKVAFAAGLFLVPMAAIAVLLWLVPKFNARYFLPASIALPLLWGLALDADWRNHTFVSEAVMLMASLILLIGSWQGLSGMYWDERLTRDDFRGAIAFIAEHLQPDEAVLLSSGHIYPVWQYYMPDTPYIALPPSRVLSVQERLGFEIAEQLDRELLSKSGAWLLLWQDEVTDPMGVLPYLLDQAGAVEEEGFWQVRVRHYRFAQPVTLMPQPVIQRASTCDFGGLISFLGLSQPSSGEVVLFWRARQSLNSEYRAQLIVRDRAGHSVATIHTAPAGEHYPTSLWRAGELTFGRVRMQPAPGIPSGEYQLSIGVYDAHSGQALTLLDQAGNPQGQSCTLGAVSVSGNTSQVDVTSAIRFHNLRPLNAQWQNLRLLGAGACPPEALPPGTQFSLPLLWQSSGVMPPLNLAVRLDASSGPASVSSAPLSTTYPNDRWHSGEVVLTWLDLTLPADSPPGPTSVTIRPITGGGAFDDFQEVCQYEVKPVVRQFVAPRRMLWPSEAIVGGFARLLGIDASSQEVQVGTPLQITVHWQTLATPNRNYQVFLHLLGPDGKVWAQHNAEPLMGQRPTAGWLPGEVISDTVELLLDPSAPPGAYQIELGLFDQATAGMPRLEAEEDGKTLPDNAIRLGEVMVRH